MSSPVPAFPSFHAISEEELLTLHAATDAKATAKTGHAPASWTAIGKYSAPSGGIGIVQLLDQHVQVAISPRKDGITHVTAHFSDGIVIDSCPNISIPEWLNAPTIHVDSTGKPTAPPQPTGGLAARIAAIIYLMGSRQALSQDNRGFDITFYSPLPVGSGMNILEAMDAAVALTLGTPAETEQDIPPQRYKLAEICTAATKAASKYPTCAAAHHAILRSPEQCAAIIDFSDGALTQLPSLYPRQSAAWAVLPELGGAESYLSHLEEVGHTVRRTHDFVYRACHVFGVENIALLPDAPARISQWLEAVHRTFGPKHMPTPTEAARWLDYWHHDTARAQELITAVRGLRQQEISNLLSLASRSFADMYGGRTLALAELGTLLGGHNTAPAPWFFPTTAGNEPSLLAVFPATNNPDFAWPTTVRIAPVSWIQSAKK